MRSNDRVIAWLVSLVVLACVSCRSPEGPRATDETRELSNVSIMGVDGLESSAPRETFSLIQYTPDPIERFNRASLVFTKFWIDWGVKPVAKVWRFVFPAPVRRSLDNFGYNISWPTRFVSLLLQGRPIDSATETGHFLVNSTLGLAGLLDPARHFGIPTHREDIGQAFASWNIGPGFYFVIPFLGPSSARDSVGRLFDTALDPATYVTGAGLVFNLNAFTFRIDGYEALTSSETNLYLPIRALWTIQRTAEIRDYSIPDDAYLKSDPEPSLGVLRLAPRDPTFARRAKTYTIDIASTNRKLPYSLWLQRQPAPLLFILPGIGSHRTSATPVTLAEQAFEHGYSVAIISSVFHPEFIERALPQPLPGNTRRDVDSVYVVLEGIKAAIEQYQPGLVISSSLMRYSLGGVHSLFLASGDADRTVEQLRFDRIVAINPPVDMMQAARSLDAYFDAPLIWPTDERDERVMEIGLKGYVILREGIDSARPLPFDRPESEFMVALAFRKTIIDAVAAIGRRTGTPLEIAQSVDPERGVLLGIVNESTLEHYVERLVLPYFLGQQSFADHKQLQTTLRDIEARSSDREALLYSSSLHSIESDIARNDCISVFTNADDFLLEPNDLDWLLETLGERLTVFTAGGHLGNLHEPAVQEAIFEGLSRPCLVPPPSDQLEGSAR